MNARGEHDKTAWLFPFERRPLELSDEKKAFLLKEMISDKATDGNILAGYTYLGQLISHDIVPKTRGKNSRRVTPFLNLDSFYGEGDFQSELFDEKGKFILGAAKGENSESIEQLDLNRNKDKLESALIPESRNDENILVSQLHLFWQKFHNQIIDDYVENELCRCEKIIAAKSVVVKTFQLIVIYDFLFQLLDPNVYDLYFKQDKDFFYKNKENNKDDGEEQVFSQIPFEFSQAIFRFGHSMVREKYLLNEKMKKTILLSEILRNTWEARQIPENMTVNWFLFFGGNGISFDKMQFSSKIDTLTVPSMSKIPPSESENNGSIVMLNLLAGKEMPTGQQTIAYIQGKYRQLADLFELNPSRRTPEFEIEYLQKFKSVFNIGLLPLWLYILLEARTQRMGMKLGLLGSIIVAEVLKNSIRNSKLTIFNNNVLDHENIVNGLGQFGEEHVAKHLSEGEISFKMEHVIEYVKSKEDSNGNA